MAAENPLRIRMTRSSSAPPRMEGSIPTIDEESSVNSSLNDFKNTPKRVKSEEHLPSGPGSISFHKEEASQDLSESSSDATPENNTISSPSCQDSSIDRIQDCSASNTKIGEPAAYDANPITLKSLRVDKRSEPSSQSLDHPYQRDESRAKHAKKGCRSASGNIPRVDSVDNLYSKRNHDKHESLKNHVPELRVPMQEYVPNRVHRSPGQTSSHGMLHESFPSENHHFSNPQPFSLYGPQQAYAFCSTFFSPFMTGYSPHSLIPLSSGPSYVGHYLQPACDTSAQASFGAHLVPPKPFHVSYFGDRKFHLPLEGSSNVPAQRKTEISGHGNRPFVNDMTLDSIRIQRTYSDGKRGSNDCDESRLKFSFLEELKSNNGHNFELSDIEGRIVDFSVDQQGSRFIQQKLEHCSDEEKMAVFNEVVPHISRLMADIFGNFVIQKFLELGSLEQRKELAEKLSGKMLCLSLQEFGCRVIQKALQVVNLEQKLLLAKELDGHAMKCARDQNGNHVIQKCIECLPTQETGFIISSFKGHVPELASHPYGCRVIQTILERYSDDTQRRFIVNEILESAWFLSRDQFGNYVIQYILKRGKPDERSQIIDKLARKVVDTSRHKYASHVVEQCLEYGNTKEQELLIEEILELSNGEDNLLAMMKDQYANYVVQKAFEIGNERQREALIHRARVHLRALRKSVFGKHIVAFCERNSVNDRE